MLYCTILNFVFEISAGSSNLLSIISEPSSAIKKKCSIDYSTKLPVQQMTRIMRQDYPKMSDLCTTVHWFYAELSDVWRIRKKTHLPDFLHLKLQDEFSGSEKKICPYALLYQVILLLPLTTLIKQCNRDNLERAFVLNVCLSLSHCVVSWPSSWSLLYGVSLIICIFSSLSLPRTIKLVKCLFLFTIWAIDIWDWQLEIYKCLEFKSILVFDLHNVNK